MSVVAYLQQVLSSALEIKKIYDELLSILFYHTAETNMKQIDGKATFHLLLTNP